MLLLKSLSLQKASFANEPGIVRVRTKITRRINAYRVVISGKDHRCFSLIHVTIITIRDIMEARLFKCIAAWLIFCSVLVFHSQSSHGI
jgi:hypothetical protein